MGKTTLYSLIIFIAVCLAVHLPPAAGGQTSSAPAQITSEILAAMAETKAHATLIEWRASLPLGTVTSSEELGSRGHHWSHRFGLPQASVQQHQDRLVYASHQDFGGSNLRYHLIGIRQQQAWDTFLIVTIQGMPSALEQMEMVYHQVAEQLNQARLHPQFSTCIRGMYNDTLNDDQQEEKLNSILRNLQAKEVERLQDETVTSVSAYTERWMPFITTNDRKMNVQVASHLDKLRQVTRLTVGTPIITAEY